MQKLIITPRSLAITAAVMLVPLSAAAGWLNGADAAVGTAASGAVMILNLVIWTRSLRAVVQAMSESRATALPAGLITVKVVGLALLVFGLQAVFPLSAVLAGCSVVVAAILLHAMLVSTGGAVLGEV